MHFEFTINKFLIYANLWYFQDQQSDEMNAKLSKLKKKKKKDILVKYNPLAFICFSLILSTTEEAEILADMKISNLRPKDANKR